MFVTFLLAGRVCVSWTCQWLTEVLLTNTAAKTGYTERQQCCDSTEKRGALLAHSPHYSLTAPRGVLSTYNPCSHSLRQMTL